ncbi:virulence promoting factor [Salmonella enterica subsp. enterica]|nr:virulence promoting factor [Salmonella enterica subsp. enterica]
MSSVTCLPLCERNRSRRREHQRYLLENPLCLWAAVIASSIAIVVNLPFYTLLTKIEVRYV